MTTPTTYIEGMVIFKQTWTVHFFRNHSLRTINTSQGAVRVIASETLPSMTRSTAFSPVAPVNIKSISYFFADFFRDFLTRTAEFQDRCYLFDAACFASS